MTSRSPEGLGLTAALSATLMWGALPVFWKQLAHLSPFEVLAHRTLWTALLTLPVILAMGKAAEFASVYRRPKAFVAAVASSALITGNGLIFVWAVSNGRITDVSLGYYLTPLLNALLGAVWFGETRTRLQSVALALAGLAVLQLAWAYGDVPWVGLGVAFMFGFYGLVRKAAPTGPLVGLNVEMTLASPLALLYLLLVPVPTPGAFVHGAALDAPLLVLSGVVSAVPLWLFNVGAKRLPYTLVGLLLYVAPSMQLMLAVLYYGEAFPPSRALAFVFLWAGIALYLRESLRLSRDRGERPPAAAPTAEARTAP